MLVFVTVGSTRFDTLVQTIFTDAVLKAFHAKGYNRLIVQSGNSSFELDSSSPASSSTSDIRSGNDGETRQIQRYGVEIEVWKFKPSLEDVFREADLVISHAGSGTILEVLRMGKAMIIVPNETLLDNHQAELAEALNEMGHLKAATTAFEMAEQRRTLGQAIAELDPSELKPFPAFDPSRFAKIMDECMGFA